MTLFSPSPTPQQPVPPSVRAYLEKEVVPALMPVLTEMARTRPADPLEWLATRLRAAADAAKAAPKVEEGA